nr:MAG: major capsid protein [Microviridae sp.]
MQKVAFGGERLGSGGKINVELKPYNRSTHDLGYIWRSSMAVGTLVPFMVEVGLPGDTFDIKLNADVKTHPTLGPLFGSFKLQLDIFECPVRLYHSALMQNTTQVGNTIQNIILPVLVSDTITPITPANTPNPPDVSQINSAALLSYLGIRGWGLAATGQTPVRIMNAIPFMAYWEIYKNYYANKQELNGYYLQPIVASTQTITSITVGATTITQNNFWPNGTPGVLTTAGMSIAWTGATGPTLSQIILSTSSGLVPASQLGGWSSGASPWTLVAGTYGQFLGLQIYGWSYQQVTTGINVTSFPLTNIDAIKNLILQSPPTSRLQITSASAAPYGPSIALANTISSQCGLGLKTYQSDINNNWMQTAWYNAIQTATQIPVTGPINVDTIILQRKVYDLLNRIAISGGSYQDWINAAYDHTAPSLCITPIYHGGLSKEVIFQEVVSMSQSSTQPLGTLAGRGAMHKKHKGGDIRIKLHEHSYIIGIVSITPRLDYSQGNAWHTYGIMTMNDFHKPGLDGIGWQNMITEKLAWWDTQLVGTNVGNSFASTQVAGQQPAWLDYTTNVNRCYGNFAVQNNEMFMTLNRRYTFSQTTGHIQDLTTYIDPSHYNFIFAQTNLDAQNFWVQIAVDNTARRKMSASLIPNL